MSIELHIERLVIDEALLAGEPADRLRASIERELTRRLAQPGAIDTLRNLGTVAAMPPASLQPASGQHDRLGMRIATAMRQGLGLASTTHLAGKGS